MTGVRNLVRPLLGGLKSFLPRVDFRGSGGSTSARYCYAVWLRHVAAMRDAGVGAPRGTLVELGPGDTLGVSLAALLSGVERAVALDVVPHADAAANRAALAELVALFRARAAVPGDDEFPAMRPRLGTRRSPGELVGDATIDAALASEHVARIDAALGAASAEPVRYVCPWSPASVAPGSADLVLSQAVLEYLRADGDDGNDALDEAFAAMRGWLRPGGVMSHQIDLSGPFGPEWNAHWAVGDAVWRVIRGRRPVYENRVPLSGYLRRCERHGFAVLAAVAEPAVGGVAPSRLAGRFRSLPEADHAARGVHLIARKR